jgi:uncharacterized protein (AIM24 family)
LGAVLPTSEDCATATDEDCDGLAPACKGNELWSKRFGDASGQHGTSVAVDDQGNVVVTGFFAGAIDLGGGALLSAGGEDLFVAKLDASGNHLWSKRFGDAANQYGQGIGVDSAGNVFVTGYFSGAMDFGAGALQSAGGEDLFVVKLDASGNPLWSKSFGDAADQNGACVAVDSAGNVLVTGSFSGSADFGGGALQALGNKDIFLLKLDANGAHLWSSRFGDAMDQHGESVAVDGAGNVLVTGSFSGAVDFGGGTLQGLGNKDIFLLKLDANGAHLWSKSFGDSGLQDGKSIAVDGSGNVLVTGLFTGTIDFGGVPLKSAGGSDLFVAKLDANGNPLWSKSFGDMADQYGAGVAVDSAGNALVTGSFLGVVDFGGGALPAIGDRDIFLLKLDANGAHQWSRRFGDAAAQFGQDVAVDGAGNVLVTGSFGGAVDFGGGNLPSAGSDDGYLAKFAP